MDKRKLAEQLGLKVFDTALPQPWVDAAVNRITYPREKANEVYGDLVSGLVWCYDFGSIGGFPVAVSPRAANLLARLLKFVA